ncbi:MAG TPA: hypothetical protein VM077_01240 [Candidatus Limnocylindrales bacterium]|nr:hypothetical protein [Candidatus Limnocylindrales bacterium]
MKEIFLYSSSIFFALAYISYIISILRGRTKPHRTTRFVVLVVANITTLSLIAQDSSVAIWIASIATIFSWIVFLLSLKYGIGGWSKTDIACLIIALLGIYVWKITNNPQLAFFASIIADFIGMLPAFIRTYRHPRTEGIGFYAIDAVGAGLNLLAISAWLPQEYIYPLYYLFLDACMLTLIFRQKIKI